MKPRPRLLIANLSDKEQQYPAGIPDKYVDGIKSMVGDWQIETVAGKDKEVRVGIIGVVGPMVAKKVHDDDSVKFATNVAVLPGVLKALNDKGKPDLRILLYQGNLDEAQACAKGVSQFDVVQYLNPEPEPPAQPKMIGHTQLITVGEKGKYIGVVGVFKTGKPEQPFTFRYQLVALGPEYATLPGNEKDHPIMKLMEQYTKQLHDDNCLARYSQGKHPLQSLHTTDIKNPKPAYVGSDACKKCHDSAYTIWKDSGHAHAYQKLVDAKNPSLRQYDPECIVCHMAGYGNLTGYVDEKQTPGLKNVDCEACHGPGSLHKEDPKNAAPSGRTQSLEAVAERKPGPTHPAH